MTPLNYLTDDQIANVLTYVRNSFGNEGAAISMSDVKKVRATIAPPEANPFE
jgi:nitrite reductase (NO-forming)